jgi:hypothetical protein
MPGSDKCYEGNKVRKWGAILLVKTSWVDGPVSKGPKADRKQIMYIPRERTYREGNSTF